MDHTLVVPMQSPGLFLQEVNGAVTLDFKSDRGMITHRSPPQAVTRLAAAVVNSEVLAAHLVPILKTQVPASVGSLKLTLRNEVIDGVFHHYTHGLKKHDGHCQRIAHGHRSRIDIRVDGQRDPELETTLAAHWRDIYLATQEDLTHDDGERLHFEYVSREGAFALALPKAHCDRLDTDTTIECIAQHLASKLADQRPGRTVEVRAYEGVMKGARAFATSGSAA